MYTFFINGGALCSGEEETACVLLSKKAAAEQKAAAGKFSRGGLYCDIEFLSVPYLTIA